MTILLNNLPVQLPKEIISISDFVKWEKIPMQGTAIAINDKLVKQEQWNVTNLKDMDIVTVISAAYGG